MSLCLLHNYKRIIYTSGFLSPLAKILVQIAKQHFSHEILLLDKQSCARLSFRVN